MSVAKDWEHAKLEWQLEGIYFSEEPQTCLCGHFPIKEICVIQNHQNQQLTEVGNCCVKKFLGLPSDLIFQGIKRVRIDDTNALNEEAIVHARKKGWINDWEYKFCLDVRRKRILSSKQLAKRQQINQRVLEKMAARRKP